ncbi:MAG: aminotransferase class V-fold PLP-dependent enzyme [Candidatus Limnocylindrales bacterium]|jgi:selenocysteine lyase/cysteine desulfurase
MQPRPLPSLPEARAEFIRAYPEFEATRPLDELRATDYARLDRGGDVFLDYTAGGVYADSQVRAHADLLRGGVFGNPHSTNRASLAMTELVERARARVLEFFRASPDEYVVCFTQNASGALRLVGEAYPFCPDGRYVLTFDNHNSVNGIREFARAKGARVTYAPVIPPDMRIDEDRLAACLEDAGTSSCNLLAYPAQSNFSGVQHSLDWIERAYDRGWDVLLDAAAFVPTNRLDLGRWHPDFVPISFYKMFGYPTGVGALIARRPALGKLHRPWFAGGTITVASVRGDRYYMQEGAAAFEDGTLDYLSLPAVEIGLRHIDGVGLDLIHTRVRCLTDWLLRALASLRHGNGEPVVHIYGPLDSTDRGGTVALNLYDARGHFIDHRIVERRANDAGISLRTGCFCNPGGGEVALGLSAEELSSCFVRAPDRLALDEFRRCIDDKSTGAVRVSLGLVTTFADVHRFVEFAAGFADGDARET